MLLMFFIFRDYEVCSMTLLTFRGVVRVDVRLDELDINQCPQEYHIPNAFKATARCHYESTYVSISLYIPQHEPL